MVRHPLYFFSLVGALGVGLASENVLVLVLVLAFYLTYYPPTIRAEEAKLTERLGQDYVRYMQRVPRFVPRLALYKEPSLFHVKTSRFVRNFGDAAWFVWVFILLHLIESLQVWGVLPVLWRVP